MRRLTRRSLVTTLLLAVLLLTAWPAGTLAGEETPECPEGEVFVPANDGCFPIVDECPEGLIYDAALDSCVLPEGDTGAEEPPAEEPPAEEPPAEEPPAEEPPAEEPPAEEPPAEEPPVDEEPADEAPVGQGVIGDGTGETMRSFTILPLVCPYGSPVDLPLAAYRTLCVVASDPEQTLTASRTGGTETFSITATGQQDLGEGPLPSGTWRVEVAPTDTYTSVMLACGVTSEPAPATTLATQGTLANAVDVEVLAGQAAFCEALLFAAVPADGPTAGMNVTLRQCPEFFRETSANGGIATCPAAVSAPVTVEAGRVVNGVPEALTYSVPVTPPSGDARVAADGSMRSGEWYVRVAQPPGSFKADVYCSVTNPDGSVTWSIALAVAPADNAVSALLGPDHMLDCDYYLYAGNASTSVAVVALHCPDDFDPATSLDRDTQCLSTSTFWDITVAVDGGEAQTAESQRNATVAFPTQPGAWRIAVTQDSSAVPYRPGFVSCDHTVAALATAATIEPTLNGDSSVNVDLDAGDGLLCRFYITALAPAAAASTPTPETAPTAPTPTPEPAAPTPTAAPAPSGQTTDPPPSGQTTAPPPAGQTTNPPPSGQTTNPPTGGTFGGGGTSSSSGSSSGPGTGTGSGTGTGTGTGEGDDTPSQLSIQHWDCPGPFGEATVDELIENCAASPNPSSWDLNGEPVEATDGYVVFPLLPPEPATVTNTTGGEGTESLVWCMVGAPGEEPLASFDVAVDGATNNHVFDRGTEVYCNWFVAPPPPEEGASAIHRRT